jgi:hypothetical protein
MCHIYTQHTIVHSFTVKQYDRILNTENVLTAMVQNYHFSDTHHTFPLISLNVQITYTTLYISMEILNTATTVCSTKDDVQKTQCFTK